MALILKNNILYLHIPKTGGNWLTTLANEQNLIIGKLGHKHATYDYLMPRPRARSLRSIFGPWRNLHGCPTILCVVRNPLSWYESWFRYQTKGAWRDWGEAGNPKRWHVCAALNICKKMKFMEFLKCVNQRNPGFVTRFFGRYTQGANATILRNETLAQDFVKFAERMKLSVDSEVILKSRRIGESPKMDLAWDTEVLRETVENETAAFRAYGYKLPEI